MPKDSKPTNHLPSTLSSVKTRLVKRFAIFVLFFLLSTVYYLSSTASPIHAQACNIQAPGAAGSINQINKCAIEAKIFDDKIFNLNQIAGTADSLSSLLTGVSQLHPETNPITKGQGALAASGSLVVALYSTPPASGVQYLAQTFQKLNPNQPVYAAPGDGIGFNALQPVQNVWTAFRNIAYAGFVVIFVVIGFMIMFRSHISSQAVATIQDSIPRIVVAILLVTFSYAIAGLMIDLMFLILNVLINSLQAANLITDQADTVLNKNVFSLVLGSWTDTVKAVSEAIYGLIKGLFDDNKLTKVIGFFAGGVTSIIFGVAMLFIMIRIFMMLLMAYITIILLTISAPFFFLFQALPGNNSAMSWFKQMASNVAVFPAVAMMFVLGGMFGSIKDLGGGAALQPFTQGDVGQFPLLAGGLGLDNIGQLIGFGLLIMTPSAAQMVKDAFGVKGGIGGGAGAAAGAALGGAAGVVRGYGGGAAKGAFNTGRNFVGDNYDGQGNSTGGKARYINPNYWRRRGQLENAVKETRARRLGDEIVNPQQGQPAKTWKK